MNKWKVYKHTCPNEKVYIGITSHNPLARWRNGLGYKGNKYFWHAIQKYGWDNISHEVLFDNLSKDDACEKEIQLIAHFKSNDPLYGYNRAIGGEVNCGYIQSEETKRKISSTVSNTMKGNVFFTDEHRKKLSQAAKQKVGPLNSVFGKPKSKQWLEKNCRPVQQFDKNGNLIAEFDGVRAAYRETGISPAHCLNGNCKTAGGFIWKYKEV